MDKERINKFIASKDITIVDAMGMIDKNSKGIIFIVSKDNALIGSLTDGDIRRWIINAGNINDKVELAMNMFPKYIFAEKKDNAKKYMIKNMITAVPVVDEDKKIIDIILLTEEEKIKIKKKTNMQDTPIVLMAGGKGTRLYPYTKILPKPLIPIGDTPIIERIINSFLEYNIQKFHMTVNYKKEMIKSYFAEINPIYEIKYVEEEKPLGTGGSIKLINENFTKPVIIANCDSLIRTDYWDLYEYHIKSKNDITIVSALKNIIVPYGVLHNGESGELISIEEKPKISYLINTGMYVINPEVIKLIPENTMFHMTRLVEAVMKNCGKVGIYPISEDSFLDMGEFSEKKRMEEKLNIVLD